MSSCDGSVHVAYVTFGNRKTLADVIRTTALTRSQLLIANLKTVTPARPGTPGPRRGQAAACACGGPLSDARGCTYLRRVDAATSSTNMLQTPLFGVGTKRTSADMQYKKNTSKLRHLPASTSVCQADALEIQLTPPLTNLFDCVS